MVMNEAGLEWMVVIAIVCALILARLLIQRLPW